MSAAAAANTVRQTSEALGTEIPTTLQAAFDQCAALIEAAERISQAVRRLHAVSLDCLAQGRDPAADKLVARAALEHQLANSGLALAARERAEISTAAALTEHADELMASWARALQPHLDRLSEAARELDGVGLEDTATITARGAPALAAWASATEALRLVRACHNGIFGLATLNHVAITRDQRHVVYTRLGADKLDAIVRDTGAHVTPWTAAIAGAPLALVDSMACLVGRLASFGEQRAAAARADEQRYAHPNPAKVH